MTFRRKGTPPIQRNLSQQNEYWVQNAIEKDTYFPHPIHAEDIDSAVFKAFEKELKFPMNNGQDIPIVLANTIQRSAEIQNTWKIMDKGSSISPPFISIMRYSLAEKGTALNGASNIASNPTYSLYKIPIVKNGKTSVEYYQIPQPINVDIKYELTFYSVHQREINDFNERILNLFKSFQYYIFVKGHAMAMYFEAAMDNAKIDDIEKRRRLEHTYTFILKGYLLDDKQFKKLDSLDSIDLDVFSDYSPTSECSTKIINGKLDCDFCMEFVFNRMTPNNIIYKCPKNILFGFDNKSSNLEYDYYVNNSLVFLPFPAKVGDLLEVRFKNPILRKTTIKICGQLI